MTPFRTLIDRLVDDPSEDLMGRLIGSLQQDGSTDEDLSYLTQKLAESGGIFCHVGKGVTADIASTGGPSSLSTLLCPLYLKNMGYIVPTLAVPGRPAGGVDVLAQIPGYKVDLKQPEVEEVLQKCGYAHFIASQSFAPLDARLFSYRQKHGKVRIPELVIASLLAKKIAAGVSLVGLDVRVAPHGNFGTSLVDASRNAARLCRIASLLGLKAICFLSNAARPYQPFIGRGEALLAIWNVIRGATHPLLRKHDDTCYSMASQLAFHHSSESRILRPDCQALQGTLRDNVEAQASTTDAFAEYVNQIASEHVSQLAASRDGFLHVDLNAIKAVLVKYQTAVASSDRPFTDPCGIILQSDHGDYVRRGDLLATLRCTAHYLPEFREAIIAALPVKPNPVPDLYFMEVSHG